MAKYFRNAVVALALGVSGASHAAETVTYTYDARGRLVKVERTGTVNDSAKVEYELDKADNRKKVKSSESNEAAPS